MSGRYNPLVWHKPVQSCAQIWKYAKARHITHESTVICQPTLISYVVLAVFVHEGNRIGNLRSSVSHVPTN